MAPAEEKTAISSEETKAVSSPAAVDWKTFLLGMAAGLVLFGVLTFFISRKRSRQ